MKSPIVIALLAFAAAWKADAQAALPVSGRPVPGMEIFDATMSGFMRTNGITAGVLGISRGGHIQYLRSFGWLRPPAGADPGIPLPENAMMRTASAVKPVTAAAIREFSSVGGLGADGINARAFDGLITTKNGLLNITPKPDLGDPRHADITVSHLLLHQAGFDRLTDPPGDVMFKSRTVAAALGLPSPPSNREMMSYMLGQSLQWTPGTVSNLTEPAGTEAYSNYGYMVLGEILQTLADGGYFAWVHRRIMSADRWIPSTEFALARSLPSDRHAREPGYVSANTTQSVFDNENPIETVPTPYGGFFIEAMIAHGGAIASAPAMIRFGNAFHVWYDSGNIGQPITPANPMQNNAHSGRLDGSNTLLQQRSDGIVFYLALNRTDHGDPDFADVLGKAINTLLNGGGYSWPGSETSDGFWVSLGAENSTAGFGGYHSSYQGFQTSLDRVSDGSYLRLRAGRQDWKGRIQKRLRLDAPEGAVVLGL